MILVVSSDTLIWLWLRGANGGSVRRGGRRKRKENISTVAIH
jgi:hypothetical protein